MQTTKRTWEEENALYAELETIRVSIGYHAGLLASVPKGADPKLEAQVAQDRERVKWLKRELGL